LTAELFSRAAAPLSGDIRVPGDKSISHRALMLGAIAVGKTRVHGLLEGEDVLATAAAMRALGARVERGDDATWSVRGRGVGGLVEPEGVLDMGNSGTAARLLMGLVASHPITCFFTGDASLSGRPMARVITPLEKIGAEFTARAGGRLPLAVRGATEPLAIEYPTPVPSAQVKSAVLLAGLNAPGTTTVIERQATRDHSELMLRHFGAEVAVAVTEDGGRRIDLTGQPELRGGEVEVPGDISSAAFPLVAALIVPGSEVVLRHVGINPLRTGLLDCLREMGADITLENQREAAGEPVADLRVAHSGALKGIDVPPERAPSMIDEYPVLCAAAACAEGPTRMLGIGELRVKESDRLGVMAQGLAACGLRVEETEDSLTVHGAGAPPAGGAVVASRLDHRIAMSFLVLGMAAKRDIGVDDGGPIATSFPGFVALMNGLGAQIEQGEAA